MSDEEFAQNLLINHFRTRATGGVGCKVNVDDPPDLIITWSDGQCWGVEVTRAYQQVEPIGKAGMTSSAEVSEALSAFATELKQQPRQRSYTLYFDMPGPFSVWKKTLPWKSWKKEVDGNIKKHIASNDSRSLRFRGGMLKPGEQGERFTVIIANPASEYYPTVEGVIRKLLSEKSRSLTRWNNRFTQCWLLVLNCYPLVQKVSEVETAVRDLVRDDPAISGFDGIFWSGYPNRAVTQIFLSQTS